VALVVRALNEIALPLLPGHRVLRVHLCNDGTAAVELRRTALRLLDEDGRDLRAVSRPPILRLEPGATGALDLVHRAGARPARLVQAGLEVELPTSGPRA
jgi:hypothetical protein